MWTDLNQWWNLITQNEPKMKILSSFTNPDVKQQHFDEWFSVFCPCNVCQKMFRYQPIFFVFRRWKKVIKLWNDMRVSKRWQNIEFFRVNYHFKMTSSLRLEEHFKIIISQRINSQILKIKFQRLVILNLLLIHKNAVPSLKHLNRTLLSKHCNFNLLVRIITQNAGILGKLFYYF